MFPSFCILIADFSNKNKIIKLLVLEFSVILFRSEGFGLSPQIESKSIFAITGPIHLLQYGIFFHRGLHTRLQWWPALLLEWDSNLANRCSFIE